MIELKNIKKSFGNKEILNNVNLKVNKGEMIAIMGGSGSGKSTLLNIIGLIEKPDSGDVILNNKRYSKIYGKQVTLAHRNLIGYIFQNFALVDNETVSENLDIALEYVNKNKKEKQLAKQKVLEYVGLSDKMDNKVYELSGGEQQRVSLARVMLKPCEIILADEPTGSLDEETSKEILQILKQLNKNGKTILIVTHNVNIANECDKIYTIKDCNLINL